MPDNCVPQESFDQSTLSSNSNVGSIDVVELYMSARGSCTPASVQDSGLLPGTMADALPGLQLESTGAADQPPAQYQLERQQSTEGERQSHMRMERGMLESAVHDAAKMMGTEEGNERLNLALLGYTHGMDRYGTAEDHENWSKFLQDTDDLNIADPASMPKIIESLRSNGIIAQSAS